MMISKNYLTTYLNGAPRFDKPILIYWVQLVCVKLFGINEFAFRLPSALAGTAWATSIFLFVRKESGNRQAFLAAAMMVLSLQVIVIAKAAIADGLLNCFLAITMFALINHFKTCPASCIRCSWLRNAHQRSDSNSYTCCRLLFVCPSGRKHKKMDRHDLQPHRYPALSLHRTSLVSA